MKPDKKHLEDLTRFIRAHRNSEGHFETVYNRLVAEHEMVAGDNGKENAYSRALHEIITKQAADYKEKKQKGISAWSEFENVINRFEKAVTDALHPL